MDGSILLVGGDGQLGSEVLNQLTQLGIRTWAPSVAEFDITNPTHVAKILVDQFEGLAWCINCAAYTAVDQAESDRDECMLINTYGPSILAKACAASSVRLIHISTDFVFDGHRQEPYVETDPVSPIGVYARSKAEGEAAIFAAGGQPIVLRTAWLYGPTGKNFPKTIVKAHRAGKPLRVVADQVGSPTSAEALAKVLVRVVEANIESGIYHAAGPEVMSWFELAQHSIDASYRAFGQVAPKQVDLTPCTTDDWPTPAKRPAYSALDSGKLMQAGIPPIPSNTIMLERMFAKLGSDF